jgi:predicted nucleic acid-binding protein
MSEQSVWRSKHDFNARRILFDTNILLDAIDEHRPESQEACFALRHCNGGGDLGLVTSGSLKDVYYVLSKRFGEKQAREAVGLFLDLLVVAPVGEEECVLALKSNEPDFEDGQVRAAAELNDVSIILTRDADAFRYSMIRTMTSAQYKELVQAEG